MLHDPSLEQFVNQQLVSGKRYDALVEEALHLLREREAVLDRIAEQLRPAVERFKRGEPGIPFDAEGIIRRGRARLNLDHGTV